MPDLKKEKMIKMKAKLKQKNIAAEVASPTERIREPVLPIDRVYYNATNESLKAIIHGLKITSEDKVLAVLGSGDQSFAMIAAGAKSVTAIDINPAQVQYANYGVNLIKYYPSLFLNYIVNFQQPSTKPLQYKPGDISSRVEFFSMPEVLSKLQRNISRLNILQPGDIFDVIRNKQLEFNKLYLSNIRVTKDDIILIENALPLGGIAYVILSHDINHFMHKSIQPNNSGFNTLKIDLKLTQIAMKEALQNKDFEYQNLPTILRKEI